MQPRHRAVRGRRAGRNAEYRGGGRGLPIVCFHSPAHPREDQTMHSTISRIRLAGLGLAALLATGSIAAAETVQLKADLKGSTAAAAGNATVTYDTASKQVTPALRCGNPAGAGSSSLRTAAITHACGEISFCGRTMSPDGLRRSTPLGA